MPAEEPFERETLAREVLLALYAAFDDLAVERLCACGPGCAVCCSDRVLITSLEAGLVAQRLRELSRPEFLEATAWPVVGPASRPASTFNALARLCLARQEPPAEAASAPTPGACPLLQDGLCLVYPVRPLACRSMASRRVCQPGGWAEQDPWWVTVNTAFFQLVEQASAGGWFGLMPEVLAGLGQGPRQGLLACENLPGLPAPAEHQAELTRLLEGLFRRPLHGRPLGLWLNQLRLPVPSRPSA